MAIDEPAAVVEVQMATDHEVDLGGVHTDRGEGLEQPAAVEGLVVHRPDASIDEHETLARMNQKAPDREAQAPVGVEDLGVKGEVGVAEEVVGSGEDAIQERLDVEVAQSHISTLSTPPAAATTRTVRASYRSGMWASRRHDRDADWARQSAVRRQAFGASVRARAPLATDRSAYRRFVQQASIRSKGLRRVNR